MRKLKYLSIVMMILVNSLASSQGYTRISSQLKQKNDLSFPLLDSYDLLGGAVSGTEKSEVPQERRKQGMLFLDTDDDIAYQLVGGTADINWQKFTGGGYWSETDNDIFYNDGDVKIGSNLFIDQIKLGGNNASMDGLRIGNPGGTSAGSNILFGLNHESDADWDIFQSNLSGANGNVFIGIDNIYQPNITADNNIAIGKWTGRSLSSGGENLYMGQSAGEKNSAGWYNVSMGHLAGIRGGGHWNVDIGQRAGYAYELQSSRNINIGMSAGLIYETPGGQTNNISIGEFAGWHFKGDTTIMVGLNSGVDGSGVKNAMFGYQAGMYTNGNVNLYLGRSAGMHHTGDSCIFIGDGVGNNYIGSTKVLIDVMHRTDGAHLIDLEGAVNKRYITFNGSKLTANTDEFYLWNRSGTEMKLKIHSIKDTTIITSENALKIQGTPFVTDSEIISNGLSSFARSFELGDDREIIIAKGKQGWGMVQAGDDETFTQFRFSSLGIVSLFNKTEKVANMDMDANLCIYNSENGIAIKNRLGTTKKLNFTINYSNPLK